LLQAFHRAQPEKIFAEKRLFAQERARGLDATALIVPDSRGALRLLCHVQTKLTNDPATRTARDPVSLKQSAGPRDRGS
jgi:hypothetical protein